MVMVMAETGLRASEICSLQMKNLFLEQRYLVVLGKGERWKLCRLSKNTANIVGLWLAHRRKTETDAETVFVSLRGRRHKKPMHRFGLLSNCRHISEKVGFYFTPHVFRRLMATRMLELGATEEAVKQQGDWRSDRDFRRYIQTYRLREIEPYSPITSFFCWDDEDENESW
jgi:integrase